MPRRPSDTIDPMDLKTVNMNVHADCFPCFLKQTNIALSAAEADEATWRQVLKAVLKDIEAAEFHRSPSYASSRMHRRIRDMLGSDPFESLKRQYNEAALALLPSLREKVAGADDALTTAARLAIAGNIIDFGIFESVDVEGAVSRALTAPLGIDHSGQLSRELADESITQVLYLLDNAGEIVFDMLLIEHLIKLGKRVTAVTRGGPILNDVTLHDARAVGLDALCEVIDNGSDAVGTVLDEASDALMALYGDPKVMVISKGQGNFETLLHEDRPVYYLFQAKCSVVADALSQDNGAMLLMRGGSSGGAG